jgi:hypothetical protein
LVQFPKFKLLYSIFMYFLIFPYIVFHIYNFQLRTRMHNFILPFSHTT